MKNFQNEIQKLANVPVPRQQSPVKLMQGVTKRAYKHDAKMLVQRNGFLFATDFFMMLRLKNQESGAKHIDLNGVVWPVIIRENGCTAIDNECRESVMPDFEGCYPLTNLGEVKNLSKAEMIEIFQNCQKLAKQEKATGEKSLVCVRFGETKNWFNPAFVADCFRFFFQIGETVNVCYDKGNKRLEYHPLVFTSQNGAALVMPIAKENTEDVYINYINLF